MILACHAPCQSGPAMDQRSEYGRVNLLHFNRNTDLDPF
jgi:hypothetical protein